MKAGGRSSSVTCASGLKTLKWCRPAGVQNTTCVSIGGQPGTLQAICETITVSSAASVNRARVHSRTRSRASLFSSFLVKPSMPIRHAQACPGHPRPYTPQLSTTWMAGTDPAMTKEERLSEKVLAAVRVGPSRTELREFPMPDIPDDAALMKMEVGGICGTDVKLYKHPPSNAPVIMGHENIGTVAKAGREFTRRKGFKEGDLVFVEHYVSCGKCEWCHAGQYRHCENTNWRTNPDAIRYGYTSAERAPHLWGGFAQYVYLPWNAVVHHVPKGVTPELAGLVTPMANGVEWSLFDGGVGYNSTVLIQGPGQQGLSQTVICKQAGASLIIVTGTSKDKARLDVAKKLGADHVIDVQKEDPLARVMTITGGKGVDVSLDCTAGAGTIPVLLGIEALKRKGGVIVAQGEMAQFPNFPLEKFTVKFITMKSARGHSYKACELALAQLASKRFPLELITTHRFGLDEVDLAIRSVGGEGVPDVIHASLMPWL